ncbi:16S rRNA (cytosine(1402)-N(4))-methyltransferase RsmH [Candidatus Finniella inopinata]|uniref:Ribosomal RNA small subunit methyltransferase H n=2 Tax=Candidatus Finniella inopinata TaxID=1696036 RepID=A0A4V2DZR4_9PROT|nr:16S rRNA (cytosine(1402)-N(4))-methyltransferase RsmH [Candidatus Finniella inopinata]
MLKALNPESGGVYVDATFGGGGYTCAILDVTSCTVVGLDRDPAALIRAQAFKTNYPDNFRFVQGCFSDIDTLLLPYAPVDGIVFDFGVSSYQLDEADRGFSFRFDGPLDMRMSQTGITAADVVNTYSAENIAQILWSYGEEPRSRKIAQAIVEARRIKPITTTLQLANIVRQIVKRTDSLDPATLTFQGLRIFVNNELIEIDKVLRKCLPLLRVGGKIVTVTFQGLEDRVVKDWYQSHRQPNATHPSLMVESVFKKPLSPSFEEVKNNPRARSGKLRAFRVCSTQRTDIP